MQRKLLKFTLKLTISAIFVLWVVFVVDWQEAWMNLRKVSVWHIAIYMVLLLIGIVISSYKWQLLARFKNFNLSLSDFFKFYLAGSFINNFMPSFIGGDAYKAYQIGKEGNRYTQSLSTVIIDRVTGLWGAMILTVAFSVINAREAVAHPLLILVNIGIIIVLAGSIIMFMARRKFMESKFARRIPQKIVLFIQEIDEYYGDSHVLPKALLLSFLFNFIGLAMANFVLFAALGVQISALDYLSVVFLISIVSSIPISINNIGVKEWAYITFFGIFGASASAVITVAILGRFLQMLVSFAALPAYLKSRK